MEEESDREDNVEVEEKIVPTDDAPQQAEEQVEVEEIDPKAGMRQLTPQQIRLSQEMQMKTSQTITKFYQKSKQFKDGQQNVFVIYKPNPIEIREVCSLWKNRQSKTESNLLKLQLNGYENEEKYEEVIAALAKYFQLYPSIQLWIDGQKIENNGVLVREGDCFYEGILQKMHITNDSEQTDYEGDVVNKVPNGNGVLTCRSKKGAFMYKGSFVNGKYHGKGELKNNKNVMYIGDFENDYKHGEGIEIIVKRKKNPVKGESMTVKKSQYKGTFKDGYRSGFGVEETSHGVYEGEWLEGVRCGKGTMKYKKGDNYEGEWENNEFCGEGTYIEENNLTYKGSFVGGKYHGNGVMEYNNGDKYEGGFQNGKKHGNGIYTWEDGDYYDGQWKNDSAQGHGTSMIGSDFYDGDFKNGRKHGIGELTNEDGQSIKALFENNQIKQILEKNGEPYEQES